MSTAKELKALGRMERVGEKIQMEERWVDEKVQSRTTI